MAKEVITEALIYKNDRFVALSTSGVKVDGLKMEDFPTFTAYSLPRIDLDRVVLFEHMQGRPLSAFLDLCGGKFRIHVDQERERKEEIEPLFYVHGRSEAMRGNMTVSAVILAHFSSIVDFDTRRITGELPKIYKFISTRL